MRKAIIMLFVSLSAITYSQRTSRLLNEWTYSADSIKWESVRVPHDAAIRGPFDIGNDLQKVAVEQNGETTATLKTGRSGGLPFIGKGYYKTTFEVADTLNKDYALTFGGVMSHARVRLNGKDVIYWPYGYNNFTVDLAGTVVPGINTLEVSIENKPLSSRWYPGAGIYRNVELTERSKVHIPVWGTYITTPSVTKESSTVSVKTQIEGARKGESLLITTIVRDPQGKKVAGETREYYYYPGVEFTQKFNVANPQLWSPENPVLYTAETEIARSGQRVDSYTTRFGIRKIEVLAEKGFYLNGEKRQIQGVCLHHDLGPLGAAVNKSAIIHQIEMLKDMGADAIRTSHNMPARELVEACDSLGMMLMVESFDDWGFDPKSPNGYSVDFNAWAERDLVNMVHAYRNSPSVIMWSIGNEVPSQHWENGLGELKYLQDIVHREDPTRPVTCGMDQINAVLNNSFAATLDIPGFNYKVDRYQRALDRLPQHIILGTETASTVSSRGKYYFPVKKGANVLHEGNQSSSYDVEYCPWSNIPDDDFAADDEYPKNIGQFVWTGFDYLGEPSPYDTDAWPSHSSYFGIIDLASIPKDRYYLYRSRWNKSEHTLHVLPHWNWEGREGETTPVYVYTDARRAELFINGKSQGIREKNDSTHMTRYRLMWNDVVYEPGELKVVAYNNDGSVMGEKIVRTAGKADHLVVSTDKKVLKSNGEDLAYITVQVADKDGNIIPTDEREVRFKVSGAGHFRATANGDATSLRLFHEPEMDLFSGAATAIVESGTTPGTMIFEVTASGVKGATLKLRVE